jgi:osmotically-inducible protein OsmY
MSMLPVSTGTPTLRIDEAVEIALLASPYVRPTLLQVKNRDGRIVISGRVGSYFAKQMAQESIRSITGISAIENDLHVAGRFGCQHGVVGRCDN